MKYKIIILDKEKFDLWRGSRILDIFSKEDNNLDDAVMGFYSGLRIIEYPKFLSDSLIGVGSYDSQISFFKGPVYEENVIIKEDEVSFWVHTLNTIISVLEFERINIEFAHKALEAVTWHNLKELGLVDDKWITDIKNWIIEKEKNSKDS